MRFDPTWPALLMPYGEWIERDRDGKVCRNQFSETCVCQDIKLKGAYIGVYCHWDGDTATTGRILKKEFITYKQALNLVLGGDISSISTRELKHYANCKDWKWEDVKPVQGTIENIRKKKYGYYEHIFEDGKWRSKKC
jgi:hypothetical protein